MTPQLRQLLKQTSRSFWLTIRLLPRSLQSSIGIAYLCARLSDTIADELPIAPKKRLALLSLLQQLYQEELNTTQQTQLEEQLHHLSTQENNSETSQQLHQANKLFQNYFKLEKQQQVHIKWVLRHILSAQYWDLCAFPTQKKKQVTCLQHREELLRYCWRVAGCVGEFWGNLGFACLGEKYTKLAGNSLYLAPLGAQYGQALQLINLLRDFAEDWNLRQRCYFPGNWDCPQQAWQEIAPLWIAEAKTLLQAATTYVGHLSSAKLRLATALPAALGWQTLHLLEKSSYSKLEKKVKISRNQVYKTFISGLIASRSPKSCSRWLTQIKQQNK